MKYKIIREKNIWDLMKSVQLYLDEGWVVSGGVSAFNATLPFSEEYYMQAIILK